MMVPGRKYQAGAASYRYSINGQEKNKELNENITTALFWEYDSRIGRRWNLDPKPEVSTSIYSTFQNSPIWNNDVYGDTTRAYSAETNEWIGTTYGEKGNKALIVEKNKVAEVRGLLNGNEANKNDRYKQKLLEDQLDNGYSMNFEKYGVLYDVNAIFKFYDENGLKHKATKFQDLEGNLFNFKDLASGSLNGKSVNVKTFSVQGAEVQGNLVYKNGIVTMGVQSNFRTQNSLNSQASPINYEAGQCGDVHTHAGIYLDFTYKRASNHRESILQMIPNLLPSPADHRQASSSALFRNAVVSSDKLYLYSNNPGQTIIVDRKIK